MSKRETDEWYYQHVVGSISHRRGATTGGVRDRIALTGSHQSRLSSPPILNSSSPELKHGVLVAGLPSLGASFAISWSP